MRKAPVGTAIIWLIGVLSLDFFHQRSFHIERNWGILFLVVAFFGWGQQRFVAGDDESPPYPAVRFLRSIFAAIVSGLAFFFGANFVLMCIGADRHGNYEYFGRYPALYVIPGVIGLFFPTMLAWVFQKMKKERRGGIDR